LWRLMANELTSGATAAFVIHRIERDLRGQGPYGHDSRKGKVQAMTRGVVKPGPNWQTAGPAVLSDRGRRGAVSSDRVSLSLDPKWYSVSQVAQLLGYSETKVRILIISGDLKSLKDGRARRVLSEWVDEYVRGRAADAEDG
jgi:excisionase family DNA binding protein